MSNPERIVGPKQTAAAQMLGETLANLLHEVFIERLSPTELQTLRKALNNTAHEHEDSAEDIKRPRLFAPDENAPRMPDPDGPPVIWPPQVDVTPAIAEKSWHQGHERGYKEGVSEILNYLASLAYKQPR
jgi:hypothetical protein